MRNYVLATILLLQTSCVTLFSPTEDCQVTLETKVNKVIADNNCFFQVDMNLYRQTESAPPTEEYIFACEKITLQIVIVPKLDPIIMEAVEQMPVKEIGTCRHKGRTDHVIFSIQTPNITKT